MTLPLLALIVSIVCLGIVIVCAIYTEKCYRDIRRIQGNEPRRRR